MTSATEPSVDRSPVVDAHLHVWDPGRVRYPWLDPAADPDLAVLDRRYDLPEMVAPLAEHGVGSVVLVQAADSVEDSLAMLDVASRHRDLVAGVVAWVPLDRPDDAARLLDSWSHEPVVGIRHLVHDEPDERWLLRPEVDAGLALLAERGLTFDVCAHTPALLALVPVLAERHPDLRLVVDHLAKPPIAAAGGAAGGPAGSGGSAGAGAGAGAAAGTAAGAAGPEEAAALRSVWERGIVAAARAPTVHVKLSGLNTVAGPGWSAARFQPWVDVALEAFGPRRTLIGSDWPFARLAADSFDAVWSATAGTVAHLGAEDRARVLGGTARAVYRLP